jgi:hypothetical protein
MLSLIAAVTLLEAWPPDTPRESCWFFADETSAQEDQDFAEANAYLPSGAGTDCATWTTKLFYNGEAPLLSPGEAAWRMRAVHIQAFERESIFNLTPQSAPPGVRVERRSGDHVTTVTYTFDDAHRILSENLGAICYTPISQSLPVLDGEMWLLEYVTPDAYCMVELFTRLPVQFSELERLFELVEAP